MNKCGSRVSCHNPSQYLVKTNTFMTAKAFQLIAYMHKLFYKCRSLLTCLLETFFPSNFSNILWSIATRSSVAVSVSPHVNFGLVTATGEAIAKLI